MLLKCCICKENKEHTAFSNNWFHYETDEPACNECIEKEYFSKTKEIKPMPNYYNCGE